MTIKQQGGIFGRNPTFNNVDVEGTLTVNGEPISDFGTMAQQDANNVNIDGGAIDGTAIGASTPSTVVGTTLKASKSSSGVFATFENTTATLGGGESINLAWNYTATGGVTPTNWVQLSRFVGNQMQFIAGSTEVLKLHKAGLVEIPNGNLAFLTAGTGIDFSATSGTGTSELFDDYEEGTFTPNVSDGTSNATFAGLAGRYTKIGRIVHVEIYFININTSGLTSGNTMRIGGLPFTHVTSTFNNAILNTQANTLASTNGAVSAALGSNLTYMILIDGTSTSISSALTVAAVTSGTTDLFISGTYEAA
jgi:hypothetical protein